MALYRREIDIADDGTHADIHAWMLDKMQRFRATFGRWVKQLDIDGEDDQTA
ncbi:hypothetical protein I6F07_23945 [Ensifer sp. IC4062]|nr:hypothetical protein [Ensifer sp. IC4062]